MRTNLINLMKKYSIENNKEHISKRDIDLDPNYPSSSTFSRYFGSWKKAIKAAGLKTGKITGRPQDSPIVISDICMNIITGELLGDGSLYLSGEYRSNACFSHSTTNIYYGEYLYKKLDGNIPLLPREIQLGRNGNQDQFRTRSTTNISWTNLYNKWYKNNIKIIPNDIELTRETCLHWYLGDGYFEGTCKFSTCGFSIDENIILSQMLTNIGFKTSINKKGKYYILRMSKICYKDFLNWIKDCPVKNYEHRWEKNA